MQASIFARKSLVIAGLALLFVAGTASAGTVTGQIGVTLTLDSGCIVNGTGGTNGAVDLNFGTLDFGSQPIHFTQVDSMLTGSAGAGISVQCSAGNFPVLTFGSGLNDTASGRHLASGSSLVEYRLYSDAGHASELTIGTAIPLLADGTVQQVDVFARALGASGLTAGLYTDTIAITLDF